MKKEARRNLLFTTVLIAVLSSSAYLASLIPEARAAELTAQQKGLAILDSVIDIDSAKYSVTSEAHPQNQSLPHLGIVHREEVEYNLRSEGSKLDMLFIFANGRVQMLHVVDNIGSPTMTKIAADNIEAAKNFLYNYQTYTADPFFGELRSTLDNVDADQNLTKKAENAQLEISDINGYTTLKWTYLFNGVTAPSKFIALGFSNSFLTVFVDNWHLYNIGSKSISLTEDDAKAAALDTARAHSWSLQLNNDALEEENFNVSNVVWTALIFDCSVGADKTRNADSLMLYPVWRVGVQLNKWYGYFYGIEVDIWADTKEVRSVREAWSTLPPPEGAQTALTSTRAVSNMVATSNPTTSIAFLAITITAAGTALIVMQTRRDHSHNLRRSRFLIFGGALCWVLLSLLLIEPIGKVDATRGAGVWGSESYGAGAYPNSWRKSQPEIMRQRAVASYIDQYFASGGYTSFNHQGMYGSWKYDTLLADIEYLDNNDYAAVVHFDHGIGRVDYQSLNEWHYMSEDQEGTLTGPINDTEVHPENGIYDMDIYPRTSPGKVAFAFINTCLSANISAVQTDLQGQNWTSTQGIVNPNDPPDQWRARGLPFAWTHRLVKDKSNTTGFNIGEHISDDGYIDPDDGSQCYIGFPWGSASLEQRIPRDTGTEYQFWVNEFFYYVLHYDMSVNMALDQASWQEYGKRFETSQLRTGFYAYWWVPPDQGWFPTNQSTMAVYGNGNIRLRNYTPGWYDTFNDNSIDTSKWAKLEATGATANETNSQLEVTVPSGTGQAQAGYVTKNAYNMQNQKATIETKEFDNLDEMILQIGTTNVTGSDPFYQDNWYRILKARYNSYVYVQRKTNNNTVTKVATTWTSATGSLTISLGGNSIAFYENGQLRYSEPYALPSYNCYVYVFTSTLRERANGMDVFDNFALSPTTAFMDDFNDNNYYGWVPEQGTWSPGEQKLRSTLKQSDSRIRTDQTFTYDRYMRATVKTTDDGSSPWHVAWVVPKYEQYLYKMVYGLIHTNGNIELGVYRNGQKSYWINQSSLDPSDTHIIDISIVGTRALMWVDGTLYLDITNSYLDDYSGKVALCTPSSKGEFDDIVVFDE